MIQHIYRAQLETRHFDFEAYGNTPEQAYETLISGLHAHGKQYETASDWYEDLTDDITVTEILLGQAYRDRQALTVRS